METQEHASIDWLSLSPRTTARVIELSNENGITPLEAFSLMAKIASDKHAELPLNKDIKTDPTPTPHKAA